MDGLGITGIPDYTGIRNSTEGDERKDEHINETYGTVIIIVFTFLLGILGATLNLGVVTFYRKQLKHLVPLTYFLLATSDLCTCVCAALHCILFITLLLILHTEFAFWIAFVTYYTTTVAFRVSAFISMVFSAVRTVNILAPFKRVAKKAVYMPIIVYAAIIVVVCLVEIIVTFAGEQSRMIVGDAYQFMVIIFYKWQTMHLINDSKSGFRQNENVQCAVTWVTVLATLVPALITLLTTTVQIISLLKPSDISSTSTDSNKTKRRITMTIATISTVFFLCSLTTLAFPILLCDADLLIEQHHIRTNIFYLCGYMSMFLNATINPLIFICSGEKLRSHLKRKIMFWAPEKDGNLSPRDLKNKRGTLSTDTEITQASPNASRAKLSDTAL